MKRHVSCNLLEDWIGKKLNVVVDRKIGSSHPKWDNIIYEVNYGFIPDTIAGDGEPIDVYIFNETNPINSIDLTIKAGIIRHDDVEFKLIGSQSNKYYSPEHIMKKIQFIEGFFDITICTILDSASFKNGIRYD